MFRILAPSKPFSANSASAAFIIASFVFSARCCLRRFFGLGAPRLCLLGATRSLAAAVDLGFLVICPAHYSIILRETGPRRIQGHQIGLPQENIDDDENRCRPIFVQL